MAGHKTWAIGEEVVQSDFQPFVADQVVAVFPTIAARTAGWAAPPAGACSYLLDSKTLHVHNGSSWVCVTPVTASIDAQVTTSSAGYVDLGGPSVSTLTGGKALVTIQATLNNAMSAGVQGVYMSVDVSGATALPAHDARALGMITQAGGLGMTMSAVFAISGLTAGTHTFAARYRSTAGNAGFQYRHVTVVGIP